MKPLGSTAVPSGCGLIQPQVGVKANLRYAPILPARPSVRRGATAGPTKPGPVSRGGTVLL